jgi:hypothetical protein
VLFRVFWEDLELPFGRPVNSNPGRVLPLQKDSRFECARRQQLLPKDSSTVCLWISVPILYWLLTAGSVNWPNPDKRVLATGGVMQKMKAHSLAGLVRMAAKLQSVGQGFA